MNVFIVPSWYPSDSNQLYGIFNKRQAELLAKQRPEWNVGVSTWGQGDERFLLRTLDPRSLLKVFKSYTPSLRLISPNLTEYFSPAFIWTRKFRKGNIQGIIEANEENLKQFQHSAGKADILWAHATYPASIVSHYLSRKYGIPYVVSTQMSPWPFTEFLLNGRLKNFIRTPLQEANLLLASSDGLKRDMEFYGLHRIELISYAIDVDTFIPAKTESDVVRILCVGRIEEQKGIDLLLKACSELSAQDFQLRIGGDGSKLNDYKALSTQLGLDEKVVWLGQLDSERYLAEMQACSFYVLSSRHETFGFVVMEAMSCGKPVVVTRCGAPEEYIGENGYACEIAVDGIRTTMEKMMKSYGSFDSNVIRKDTIDRLGPSAWTNRLEALFTKAISTSASISPLHPSDS